MNHYCYLQFQMLTNFKRVLLHTRSVLKSHTQSRLLCLCGRLQQNFTEKQLRFNGVHVTLTSPYDSVHAFDADLCGEYMALYLIRLKTK